MSTFHFLRPEWLWALLPLLGLAWWLRHFAHTASDWTRICRPELLPLLLTSPPGGATRSRFGAGTLLTAAGVISLLALAGPTWERLPSPVFRDDAALIIAFDLSNSMRAEDLKPSRYERARFKIADLLAARTAGQTALVAYAGSAFAVTPLTRDTDTIEALLFALDPGIMPIQGTRTAEVVTRAAELVRQVGAQGADLLLITDGIDDREVDAVVEQALADNIRISVLAMATEGGAPIPEPGGKGLMRSNGGVVIARLAPGPIQRVVAATGGVQAVATPDTRDVETLTAALGSRLGQQREADEAGGVPRWRDMGPWCALLLLPLVASLFRRGLLFCVPMLLSLAIMGTPAPVEAAGPGDWFRNQEQRAFNDFVAKRYEDAAQGFRDPRWRAATAYRSGDYEQALDLLADLDDVESLYNKGNALAELERYDEAIEAYDAVLARDPEHEDARYNKAYLESLPERPPQGGGGDGSDDESKSGEGESSDAESSQSSDNPQSSDSKNPGGQPQPEQQDAEASDGSGQQSAKPTDEPTDEQQMAETPEAEATDQMTPNDQPEPSDEPRTADNAGELNELEQSREQYLRRIPDDPAGLLRRKFQYQYSQRTEQEAYRGEPW